MRKSRILIKRYLKKETGPARFTIS